MSSRVCSRGDGAAAEACERLTSALGELSPRVGSHHSLRRDLLAHVMEVCVDAKVRRKTLRVFVRCSHCCRV